MKNKQAFKSLKQTWKTPEGFMKFIRKNFGKCFDPCPSSNYTNGGTINGLEIEWKKKNYINPPYTSGQQDKWIKKGVEEWKKGKLCVFLIPARTDTRRWHDYIFPNVPAEDIWFIKGRLRFSEHKNPAPFPSVLVIFRP